MRKWTWIGATIALVAALPPIMILLAGDLVAPTVRRQIWFLWPLVVLILGVSFGAALIDRRRQGHRDLAHAPHDLTDLLDVGPEPDGDTADQLGGDDAGHLFAQGGDSDRQPAETGPPVTVHSRPTG